MAERRHLPAERSGLTKRIHLRHAHGHRERRPPVRCARRDARRQVDEDAIRAVGHHGRSSHASGEPHRGRRCPLARLTLRNEGDLAC